MVPLQPQPQPHQPYGSTISHHTTPQTQQPQLSLLSEPQPISSAATASTTPKASSSALGFGSLKNLMTRVGTACRRSRGRNPWRGTVGAAGAMKAMRVAGSCSDLFGIGFRSLSVHLFLTSRTSKTRGTGRQGFGLILLELQMNLPSQH